MPASTSRRVGLFGGSFDPVHLGHLLVADDVRCRLHLDRVVFVPAFAPPHKRPPVAAYDHRAAMLRLALAGEPVFSVSTVERDRPAPSYTYDTLDAFARLHPGDALFFLLGADQYADMKNWHRASELARLCRVVVLGRPGTKRPRVYRGHDPRRVRFLDVIEVAISSRQIRARLAKAESVGYMLPAPVQAYVQRHRLYRRNTHE